MKDFKSYALVNGTNIRSKRLRRQANKIRRRLDTKECLSK